MVFPFYLAAPGFIAVVVVVIVARSDRKTSDVRDRVHRLRRHLGHLGVIISPRLVRHYRYRPASCRCRRVSKYFLGGSTP